MVKRKVKRILIEHKGVMYWVNASPDDLGNKRKRKHKNEIGRMR